ncbi:MAG TPA: alkaline phosphatase D family protein, partial [Edaphobacter sp.]
NQVMVAQLDIPQNGVETHAMDMWDGYPAARKRMLDFLATRKPNNPVYITGDAHQTWVSDLKQNFDDPKSPIVASEILGTSISSGRNGVDHRPVSDMLMKANPHILYSHSRRGFFLCELTAKAMESQLWTTNEIEAPGGHLAKTASFVVEAGKTGIHQES